MIRPFVEETDLQQVVNLLERLRASTNYRGIRADWMRVIGTLLEFVAKPDDGIVLVSVDDTGVAGILIGTAEPLWWVDVERGARIASDLIFHVERGTDGRKLLDAFVDWAFRAPRVVRVELGVSVDTNMRAVHRLFRRAGFVREGTLYVKNHPQYQRALAQREAA